MEQDVQECAQVGRMSSGHASNMHLPDDVIMYGSPKKNGFACLRSSSAFGGQSTVSQKHKKGRLDGNET